VTAANDGGCDHGRAVVETGNAAGRGGRMPGLGRGNGLYDEDFSNLATIVFSVLGSLFLAAAIVRASVAHERKPPRAGSDPARDM
jgi:hypothetical protein